MLIVDECGGWGALQALLRELRAIANEVRGSDGTPLSIAQLALAWVVSQPAVGAAIVGARNLTRLEANVEAATISLPRDIVAQVTAAATSTLRPVPGEVYALEREREGKHGAIMRYNLQCLGDSVHLAEISEREIDCASWWRSELETATAQASRPKVRASAARYAERTAALRAEAQLVMGDYAERDEARAREARALCERLDLAAAEAERVLKTGEKA